MSGCLDSDHLPIVSYLLDHVNTRNLSDPVDKFTDWERFQSLAFEFTSPRNQINSGEEADKKARNFTASIASAYRLATSKIALSDLNKDLPSLESLLKHKRRLRKLNKQPGIQHVKRQLLGSPKSSEE
jgi:Na+/phosphate symporter